MENKVDMKVRLAAGDVEAGLGEDDIFSDDPIVAVAEIDPRVVNYWYMCGLFLNFIFITCVFGIVTFPLWIIFGRSISRRYLNTVKITLTKRSILIQSGGILCNCFARKEKTILLDRVQDVTLSQGCLQKCYNVEQLSIETAGQAGPDKGPELQFSGIKNCRRFRNLILAQRHQYVENAGPGDGFGKSYTPPGLDGMISGSEIKDVLVDIKGVLVDIRDSKV